MVLSGEGEQVQFAVVDRVVVDGEFEVVVALVLIVVTVVFDLNVVVAADQVALRYLPAGGHSVWNLDSDVIAPAHCLDFERVEEFVQKLGTGWGTRLYPWLTDGCQIVLVRMVKCQSSNFVMIVKTAC